MKFLCRDLTSFVAADPYLVPEEGLELVAGNGAGRVEGLDTGFKVEIDENFTQIEQKRFNLHS